METWLTDASGNGLLDGSGLLALTFGGTGLIMNGFNAGSPGEFWLYDPATGASVHVGGLPNEDFKPN